MERRGVAGRIKELRVLKFYKPLEMIVTYAEISNFRYLIAPFWSFPVKKSFSVFSRTAIRATRVTQRRRSGAFYLSSRILSIDFVLWWIASLILQKFEDFFGFVYLFAIY